MKAIALAKKMTHWLLGAQAHDTTCCVAGCTRSPTLAVAGDSARTTFMCTHHAMAWSNSELCRDAAQHNDAADAALSDWLTATRASA